MSGHSKWSQIRHKKAGADAKRGALFSKLSRMISVAARDGGTDPQTNPKLRQTMGQARASGLPKENIERAISRAAAAAETDKLQEVTYEAYGPGGSAFLILGVTDNANRTTHEIKNILSESGGKLAEAGSVGWMFGRKAVMEFAAPAGRAQEIELALIEAGAEDINITDAEIQAVVAPEKLEEFEREIGRQGLAAVNTAIRMLPKNVISLGGADRQKILILKKNLEDHPDITSVATNAGL